MKVYLLKEEDLDRLLAMIDRNPEHGYKGGSGRIVQDHEKQAYNDAHSFYNYQVRHWIDEVKK